jgi:holliday junction resolvase YEN1
LIFRSVANQASDSLIHYSTIRTQSPSSNKEEFYIYHADAIENTSEVELTQGRLILFSWFTGGDYSHGLASCGKGFAHGLARCGFGDDLLAASISMDFAKFKKYLCGMWLQNVSDELRTNTKGFLPSCKASLANTLASFLNDETDDSEYMIMALYMYLWPQTSWSHARDPNQVAGAAARWSRKEPDLPAISKFCSNNLGWTDALELVKVLRSNLWEGIVFCILFSVSLQIHFVTNSVPQSFSLANGHIHGSNT